MVFLGGAVLANIVSGSIYPSIDNYLHFPDGRQGGHVDIKAGVGGAGLASAGEAGCEIVLAKDTATAWVSFTLTSGRTKALLAVPRKPHSVLPSEAVVSVCACRDTIISPIMTCHHLHKRPSLTPSLYLVPSTSGGLYLGVVQPHGRSTDTVLHCCPKSSTCRAAVCHSLLGADQDSQFNHVHKQPR
jgi:hypothetical protein